MTEMEAREIVERYEALVATAFEKLGRRPTRGDAVLGAQLRADGTVCLSVSEVEMDLYCGEISGGVMSETLYAMSFRDGQIYLTCVG